ncbi:hypothetical protein BD626DRAFT_546884 [Schizophyllum amplum]|uniref:Peptidase S54 rhomboid domain-containing protein n=1 Tax=Schizophyllum amplum TaxID=97359 RepID=A0A550CKN9_9AGAR|nr:hypothetical protein BD626DRAFT_546884 [Auriculariopsis ampla]
MWLGQARIGALGVLRASPFLPCRAPATRAFTAPRFPFPFGSPARQFSWSRKALARVPPGARTAKETVPEAEVFSEAVREQAQGPHGPTFYETAARPRVARQILWFLGFSALSFPVAAWLTERSTSRWEQELWTTNPWDKVTNALLRTKQQQALVEDLRSIHRSLLNGVLSVFPAGVKTTISQLYVTIFQPVADASQPKRVAWSMCFGMGVVLLLQNMSRFAPFMRRNFMHSVVTGMSVTMLTSTFAHAEIFHYLLNMLAFEGFGSSAIVYLVKAQDREQQNGVLEATPLWHFLAFFCVAGTFSSLVHHVVQVKVSYPRLIRQYSAALARHAATAASAVGRTKTWADAVRHTGRTRQHWFPRAPAVEKPPLSELEALQNRLRRTMLPSLGASGAVYACLVITALAFPSAEVALFFPPGLSMNIGTAVLGAVALDITGIIMGWSFMAHWAHLGGALFGFVYYHYGPAFWADMRRIVHAWETRQDGGQQPGKRLM